MLTLKRGTFIKQYSGPKAGSDIVCFRFWELVAAQGCPFRCSYCFLQTTPSFVHKPEWLHGAIYTNVPQMLAELREWLADPVPKMLIVGELQDGLAFDTAFKKVTGKALTHHLIPLFAAQSRHRLIFLTKSVEVQHALELAPTPQVVFSWSVNSDYMWKIAETGTPSTRERFAAARRMKEAGWGIRFRLDPMFPHEGWQAGYAETIDQINSRSPEMVTLGTLRATRVNQLRAAAIKNGRDPAILDQLVARDPSNFKDRLPLEDQLALYHFALDHLRAPVAALCKEDKTIWEALGLNFHGCHCLLGADDAVVCGAGAGLRAKAAPSGEESPFRIMGQEQ
jgi:spore photoproduct lyase